jgi:hypothetical protein
MKHSGIRDLILAIVMAATGGYSTSTGGLESITGCADDALRGTRTRRFVRRAFRGGLSRQSRRTIDLAPTLRFAPE